MLKLSSFAANGDPDTGCDDSFGFFKSLQELKELRSQIHYAADYCEKSFLNARDKSAVLDNTKEYICRAVVTVVDHLGSVSTNLNHRLEKTDKVSEAELRINCLNQKLGSCDQFNQNFTLTKIRWSMDLRRFYPRYISLPSNSTNNELSLRSREPDQQPPADTTITISKEFKTDEDMRLFMYTSSNKISLDKTPTSPLEIDAKGPTGTSMLPVHEGISVAPKLIRNPSFHFQESRKVGGIRRILQWKSMNHDKEIISALKRSKREPASRLLLKLRS
ncbi:hypothetical protein Cgig2_000972 [Carnegiea gigantea]|uniref:Protein ABIL5 n=1 Tax=Carnegiea gigantea TaxID=171969 RepID=A0A9Q1JKP3_9CARY|nr:hypothetical protein Cgig2_000972 [Carnegiea gigantea]